MRTEPRGRGREREHRRRCPARARGRTAAACRQDARRRGVVQVVAIARFCRIERPPFQKRDSGRMEDVGGDGVTSAARLGLVTDLQCSLREDLVQIRLVVFISSTAFSAAKASHFRSSASRV